MWQKFIFLAICFSFDEVSPKIDVKLTVIIFNVKVILVDANGTRSDLDLSNSPFTLWDLVDLAKICMSRTKGYFVLKSRPSQ